MTPQQQVNPMAPIVQDQPRRARKSKSTIDVSELSDKLATPHFLVPPGTEPKLPGAEFGHQFGFRPSAAFTRQFPSSNIDPALMDDEPEDVSINMEAEHMDAERMEAELDNGADDDEVSDNNEDVALTDHKKQANCEGGTDEEVSELDEGEISDLDGKFVFVP